MASVGNDYADRLRQSLLADLFDGEEGAMADEGAGGAGIKTGGADGGLLPSIDEFLMDDGQSTEDALQAGPMEALRIRLNSKALPVYIAPWGWNRRTPRPAARRILPASNEAADQRLVPIPHAGHRPRA